MTRIEGDTAVLDLRGDVNGAAKAGLDHAWQSILPAAPREARIDFSRVEFINSTGIALLVGLLASARANGIAVSASGLAPHYQEIFTITRLSDFMTILPAGPAPVGLA
jgi:anti-anti-sigma factor